MRKLFPLILILAALSLAACGGQDSSGAAGAIEAYNRALIEKDADHLANLSCADWEASARTELNSFGAVTAELKDMSCRDSGQDGDFILVSCTGTIEANYGAEVLTLNLADRTYQAVLEGGEWRMCGYR